MVLQQTVSHALRGVTGKVRRAAIGYSICAVCGLAILILASSAAVLALVPLVGAVYAQLIVAGGFLVIVAGTLIWLQRPGSRRSEPIALGSGTSSAQRQAQFAQLAMIVEAIALGYSLSRKR